MQYFLHTNIKQEVSSTIKQRVRNKRNMLLLRAEFQCPCRDRNDSHTLMQCTVDSIYGSVCVVIYIFHICTRDHVYSDRLQT